MKKYTLILILLLTAFSAKAEEIYVVVSAKLSVKGQYDKDLEEFRRIHYKYVSPVIKIKKKYYNQSYTEQAFGKALTGRHREHTVTSPPDVKTFTDRKEARDYYSKQKKEGYYRLSLTRTSIEKK